MFLKSCTLTREEPQQRSPLFLRMISLHLQFFVVCSIHFHMTKRDDNKWGSELRYIEGNVKKKEKGKKKEIK